MLSGAVESLDIDEGGLTMGKGKWGVNAKNWLVNLVNTVSRVEFFGEQMGRIARGMDPVTRMKASAVGTFLRYVSQTTVLGVRRKFVRRS